MDKILLEFRDICVDFPLDRGSLRAVDHVSLDLHKGEILTVNGATKDMSSRTVYKTITARNGEGQIDLQPTAFSPESQYFHTCSIVNISNAKFNDVIEIVPYWTTLDGTVVEGAGRSIKVSDGFAAAQTARYAISADGFYGDDGAWRVWTGDDYVVLADKGNAEYYSVTIDAETHKEGEGAIQIISAANRDTNLMFKLYENGNTGITMDSGTITFWLYVSDPAALDTWSAVQLSSGWINENCLTWTLNSNMVQAGWNELHFTFAEAAATGTFDPASLSLFWFAAANMGDGVVIKLDDIRIEGTANTACTHEKCPVCGGCLDTNCSCTIDGCCTPCTCSQEPGCNHEICRLCGGCMEASCDHTDDCCSVKCPGEGNHPRDVAFTAPNVWCYWTEEGKDHLENDIDQSEEGLGYMDGERKYLCSGGLTYVPGENGSGRLWSGFISGDTNERVGNYIVLVTSDDGGETWTEVSVAIEHPSEYVTATDHTLWTDPEGRLWVFWSQEYCPVVWRNYDYDLDNHSLNTDGSLHSDAVRGVWCMYSENGDSATPTFSEPVRLCDGMMLNKPTIATIEGEETWLINPYMSSWLALDDTATSETQGPTLYTLSLGDDGVPRAEFYSRIMDNPYEKISTFRNYCEPKTVQIASTGELIMIVRTDKGIEVTRTTAPLTKAPYTGGWSELDNLRNGTEIMTKTASRTQLIALDDGTLLLIYHDTTNASRRNLTAAISTDGGYTWTDKLLLDERAVSYPDLSVAPDGSIYIQYDFDRYGLQMMYLSHITLEDIKAGELVSEGSFLNRVINDNDYNKPAPYQKSSVAIEDTAGNWFGANSTSEGYKKNGTEAAAGFTSYADSTFTVVSDGTDSPTGLAYLTTGENYIDSGMTVANGAVVFDLYVSDYSSFVSKWGIVSIGDNNSWVGGGMGNTLTWNMRNVVYQSGWNEVWLNLKDAVSGGSAIDLSHIGCVWLYSNQVPAGVEIRVRNVRFVEGSDEKPTRPESDERYAALTPANVYLRSTTDGAEKITRGADKSGRGYLSRGREFLCSANVEAIGTGDNTVLWLSTMSGGTDESRYNYAIYFASFDNGQTWQEQVVVEHSDPNVQVVDPRLWMGDDGCLYLGWQQNFTKAEKMNDTERLIGADGLQGSWAVRVENPTDAAQMSAGTPVRISDGSGINPPATVTLDGEKTLLFANALSPATELAGETEYAQYKGIGLYCYDKAEDTYKLLCDVAPGSSDTVDFYEAKALQTGDGYLYVYYRTLSGLQYIKSTQPVTSAAQNVSWSEPAYVPGADGTGQLTTVNSRSNATTVTGADGQEYILLLYHNNTANNARNHLTASLSSDGGATWSYSLELDPKYAVSYPGLKVMDDGRIFISYDYRRYDAQALFLSCITVEDIIAGELVTEGSYLNKTVIHNDHTLAEDQYQDVYQLTTNIGWVSENGQTKHWVINLPNDSGAYGYRKYDTGAEGTYGEGKNVSFSKTENAVVLKGNGSAAGVGALLYERSADTYYDLSGVTLENGALKIDIYVDDLNNVVTNGWGVIALSNGTWTGTGDTTISWRPQDYLYTDGWNTLWLPFDKATVGAGFDLSAVRTFWFAINGAAETDFIKLANISIVNTDLCRHEKCALCGGCLAENCNHTTGCCTPCTCPVYTYETTYTFPIPASNSTSWVTGGRWCAATNGSTTWQSANQVMTEDGTVLTNAADGTMTITAGQSNAGGSSKTTGLLFLISSNTGIQTGVTFDGGRLALDVYIYDPDAFKANGGTIEIADTNYKNARWINDGNRLTWDMSGMELTKGWNTLYLDLSAASFTQTASETASKTFDLGSLMYLWIYTSNMPDGEQLAVRNISFQEKTLAE